MPANDDTKVKLAAAIYGDFMTNSEVKNGKDPNFGYKPTFPTATGVTRQQWVEKLLSGNNAQIDNALNLMEITSAGEQTSVKNALPKGTDLDVALAVYLRLREDFKKLHGAASSHDY